MILHIYHFCFSQYLFHKFGHSVLRRHRLRILWIIYRRQLIIIALQEGVNNHRRMCSQCDLRTLSFTSSNTVMPAY